MPRYRILIRGQNFLLNLEGKWERYGFYTTRFAEAPDRVLAEHPALEEFRESAKYRETLADNLNPNDDPPRLSVDEMEEVGPEVGVEDPPQGLAIYNESDNEETDAE